jgi:hypothetical protein
MDIGRLTPPVRLAWIAPAPRGGCGMEAEWI